MARILLVEDSELAGDALRTLLEVAGHRVTLVGSVADAIAAAGRDAPEVVLLDLVLPDGNGLEIARHVGRSDHPPVIAALTGFDAPEVVADCTAAGCRAVLLKPLPTRELIARIDEWLQATRPA